MRLTTKTTQAFYLTRTPRDDGSRSYDASDGMAGSSAFSGASCSGVALLWLDRERNVEPSSFLSFAYNDSCYAYHSSCKLDLGAIQMDTSSCSLSLIPRLTRSVERDSY